MKKKDAGNAFCVIFVRKKMAMGVIKRRWIWLKRFRHRCGYGVHSPFAFDFLTNVVYERGEYYAYRSLRELHFTPAYWWNGHTVKCRKFLFRLANYVHPSVIRVYGHAGGDMEDYLRAGCVSAEFRHADGKSRVGEGIRAGASGDELLYAGADVRPLQWMALADAVPTEKSVCLLCGIHDSAEGLRNWERVKRHPRVSVSFDLYDYGILFFDSSKQNQHYIVNF